MIDPKTRPMFFRMSCGCTKTHRTRSNGNSLYCGRHGLPKVRTTVMKVITLCVSCGKGMILGSRSARQRYCRPCAKDIHRIQMNLRYQQRIAKQMGKAPKKLKFDTEGWMRPEDYFKTRYDQDGFPVPYDEYKKALEAIKQQRMLDRYGEPYRIHLLKQAKKSNIIPYRRTKPKPKEKGHADTKNVSRGQYRRRAQAQKA